MCCNIRSLSMPIGWVSLTEFLSIVKAQQIRSLVISFLSWTLIFVVRRLSGSPSSVSNYQPGRDLLDVVCALPSAMGSVNSAMGGHHA